MHPVGEVCGMGERDVVSNLPTAIASVRSSTTPFHSIIRPLAVVKDECTTVLKTLVLFSSTIFCCLSLIGGLVQ